MSDVLVKQLVKKYRKGDIIFKENTIGNEMYIIQSGKVQISKRSGDKDVVLEILGEKAFFGEMCLFSDKTRTADAMALENSNLIVITKNMLDMQLRNVPSWFVTMFKALVGRLEKANKRINK